MDSRSDKLRGPEDGSGSGSMGTWMIFLAWIIVLGLLTVYFSDWLREQKNPNRRPQTDLTADGVREVTLVRNRQGHYVATGAVNGQSVLFLLDTGATMVSVPENLASSMGLSYGPPGMSKTANGVITTYLTRLDEVRLGNIVLRDVQANINPHMNGKELLLGMSFLKEIEFTQMGDSLILRQ